jgi:Ca-activated chloride channel family protein
MNRCRHLRKFARSAGNAAAAALLLCALAATLVFGQTPIQVKVNLVGVSFTARDPNGVLVDNLKQDDVEVFEDGAKQAISYFARSDDAPLTLGLILDASSSQGHVLKDHEKDLEVFLHEVLRAKDKVFLVCFGGHIRLVSDFGESIDDLLAHLKQFQKHSGAFPEVGPDDDRDGGTAFYDSIYYPVTEKLAKEDGRRALLVFSDGEDNSSSHDMMTTIETAQAADVRVYTIRYTQTSHGKLNARNKYGIRVMDRVAKETGGSHVDASHTDPHVYFKQIGEELRSTYEIGYYPPNPAKDNTFRKVQIRPKNPDITVRSRTGYFSR